MSLQTVFPFLSLLQPERKCKYSHVIMQVSLRNVQSSLQPRVSKFTVIIFVVQR